jgi:RNA polymerase sigma-70 factor (ECF subfamily)
MRNIFINNYRKESRNHITINQTGDLNHLNLSENSSLENPEENMTIKEIKFFINNLNNDLKIPFSLFLKGYKYNEISEKLSLPLGTVKSRIFFARQELQRNLEGIRYSN